MAKDHRHRQVGDNHVPTPRTGITASNLRMNTPYNKWVGELGYISDNSNYPKESSYDKVVKYGKEVDSSPRVTGTPKLIGHRGDAGYSKKAYEGSRPIYASTDTVGRFYSSTVTDPESGMTYTNYTPSWTAMGARRTAKKMVRDNFPDFYHVEHPGEDY